jgi:hypothetical protein
MVKYLRSQAIFWWKIIVNFRHKFLVQSRVFILEWIERKEKYVLSWRFFLLILGNRFRFFSFWFWKRMVLYILYCWMERKILAQKVRHQLEAKYQITLPKIYITSKTQLNLQKQSTTWNSKYIQTETRN